MLYLWRQFLPKTFRLSDLFTWNNHRFFFKVTNFYRKSFGDDLLPMVAQGTNGNKWLPSTAVGCHQLPSVGITFYRWLPMGELRTHPMSQMECWKTLNDSSRLVKCFDLIQFYPFYKRLALSHYMYML